MMKVKELAFLVKGVVEGDSDIDINDVSSIESAKPGDLTFAMDEERLGRAEKSRASCVLTDQAVRKSAKCLIRVSNPKFSFLVIYNAMHAREDRQGFIHPTANVSKSAQMGKNAWIGSRVSIEDDVTIGDNVIIESNSVIKKGCAIGDYCHIYPNVTLYDNTILKNNITLHSGVVLGADGFGYVKEKDKIYKFPQLGRVIIENDVEIGANTTIDRGSLSDTVIGAGTKIDNLCQIAHNVKIGRNVLIAAQCGISGSGVVKDNVTMGGQVGIADNVTIGKNAMIGAKAGVISDIDDGEVVWGTPARPISQTKRQMAVLSWMTKNFTRIQNLLSGKKI